MYFYPSFLDSTRAQTFFSPPVVYRRLASLSLVKNGPHNGGIVMYSAKHMLHGNEKEI